MAVAVQHNLPKVRGNMNQHAANLFKLQVEQAGGPTLVVAPDRDIPGKWAAYGDAAGAERAIQNARSGNIAGGGGLAAQALAATQAGQPQITGGGQGFSIGETQIAADFPQLDNVFKGVDTFSPDNKTSPSFAVRANNIDSFRRIGSRSVRAGIAKLLDDVTNLYDGTTAFCDITCIAKASFTASTDYILFRKPDGTTHAFWFDTTGGDTEPVGSSSADASTEVDISGATTAGDVAALLDTAIDGAAIGLTATTPYVPPQILKVTAAADGYAWRVFEYVTNATFTVAQFEIEGDALSSDYRGLSILPLPASGTVHDKLLMCFMDKDVALGAAPGGSNVPTLLAVADTGPAWGRPRNLEGMKGPTLALSDQTGHVLRVNAVYDAIPSAQTELRKQSVVAITICVAGPFAGSTPRWPLDIDGVGTGPGADGTGSVYFNDGAEVNRRAYTGASTNFDMTFTAAGKYWVAAWVHSRDGTSEPSYASKTIA